MNDSDLLKAMMLGTLVELRNRAEDDLHNAVTGTTIRFGASETKTPSKKMGRLQPVENSGVALRIRPAK